MSKFTVAPTAIAKFFSCPHKFELSKKYRVKPELPVAKHLQTGIDVHKIMEGEDWRNFPEHVQEKAMSVRSWAVRNGLELEPYEELEHVNIPGTTLFLSRKIDAFGKMDGKKYIIDYKALGRSWESFGGHTPQAMGFQAISYLIPPTPSTTWPEDLIFITINKNNTVQPFYYTYNEEDVKNLIQAIEIIRTAQAFPKNRGYGCQSLCDFKAICYDLPNWQNLFDERKKKYESQKTK